MKLDLVGTIPKIIEQVGLVGFFLVFVSVCLAFALWWILRQNAKRIDTLEKFIIDLQNTCSVLKRDVNKAHDEKRRVLKEMQNLKMRCDKLTFQLEQSLQREKVLSDLFQHFKDTWAADISSGSKSK